MENLPNPFCKGLILILITLFLGCQSSFAAISFNIKNSNIPKTKILISGFKTDDVRMGDDVARILDQIKENLDSTQLFTVIVSDEEDQKYHKISSLVGEENNVSIDKIPNFAKYQSAKIDVLLVADIQFNELESKIEVKLRLWDILDERQLFGKYYSAINQRYKKMANMISNKIFENITGEVSGHFDTQIAYISESGSELRRVKRIAIMDFDGENRRYLTNGEELVLTPIFSKKPQEIFFLRYHNSRPQIFALDIKNRSISQLGRIRQTTLAPSVHPTNPDLILFSVVENGNSNIYEIDRYDNRATKLTNNPSISTTPSYSPDGKQIIFSSDRSGSEKIYVMNYDGTDLRRISNNGGSYSKPVWSPDGKLIAFTRISNNRFSIGIMTPDGKNERVVTSAYLVEGARWSPNGRYLIYSKKTSPYGKGSIPKLYMIDIVTEYERMLPISDNEGASDPDWGASWQK